MSSPGLLEQWWLGFATWRAGWGNMPYLVLFGAMAACGLAVLLVRSSATASDSEGNSLSGHGVVIMLFVLVLLAALLQTPAVNVILREAVSKLA